MMDMLRTEICETHINIRTQRSDNITPESDVWLHIPGQISMTVLLVE